MVEENEDIKQANNNIGAVNNLSRFQNLVNEIGQERNENQGEYGGRAMPDNVKIKKVEKPKTQTPPKVVNSSLGGMNSIGSLQSIFNDIEGVTPQVNNDIIVNSVKKPTDLKKTHFEKTPAKNIKPKSQDKNIVKIKAKTK